MNIQKTNFVFVFLMFCKVENLILWQDVHYGTLALYTDMELDTE